LSGVGDEIRRTVKIQVEVSLSDDRLTVRTSNGVVWLDEPALAALAPRRRSPTGQRIVAIGSEARSQSGATSVVPAFSTTNFDAGITAQVIEWAALFAWSRRRPQLKGFVAAIDRVEVRVDLEGYDALSPEDRKALAEHWPHHPQVHWWLQGENVRE
jgi:MoxR-like ATPase